MHPRPANGQSPRYTTAEARANQRRTDGIHAELASWSFPRERRVWRPCSDRSTAHSAHRNEAHSGEATNIALIDELGIWRNGAGPRRSQFSSGASAVDLVLGQRDVSGAEVFLEVLDATMKYESVRFVRSTRARRERFLDRSSSRSSPVRSPPPAGERASAFVDRPVSRRKTHLLTTSGGRVCKMPSPIDGAVRVAEGTRRVTHWGRRDRRGWRAYGSLG